jgi:hypothetical protein
VELPAELLSALMGPASTLAGAVLIVRVLWARCTKLEEELAAERAARLRDATTTADRLLGTWGKVSGAIDTLERLSSFDLPSVSVPPEPEKPK